MTVDLRAMVRYAKWLQEDFIGRLRAGGSFMRLRETFDTRVDEGGERGQRVSGMYIWTAGDYKMMERNSNGRRRERARTATDAPR